MSLWAKSAGALVEWRLFVCEQHRAEHSDRGGCFDMIRLLGGTEHEPLIFGLVKGPLPAGMTGTSGGLGGHGITGEGIPGTTSSHCVTSTTLKSLEGLHV